jgi:hypothetical protein
MAQTFITAHSGDASQTPGDASQNPGYASSQPVTDTLSLPQGSFKVEGVLHITGDLPKHSGTASTPPPASTSPATASNVQQLSNGTAITFDSSKDLVKVNAPTTVSGVTLNPGTQDQQSIVIHNVGSVPVSLPDGSTVLPSSYQGYVWDAKASSWSKQ